MTEITAEPIEVTSAQQLLDIGLELEGIMHYEHSAKLADDHIGAMPDELEKTIEHTLLTHLDGSDIGARLRTEITTQVGTIRTDIAAQYAASVPVRLTAEAYEEFVNFVALMAILPYTRQAVMDLSTRVFGQALIMPLMRRGELAFKIASVDDQADVPTNVD